MATLGDTLKKVDNTDDDEAMADQEEMDVFDEETKKLREQQQVYQNLFKGCVFFISREVCISLLAYIQSLTFYLDSARLPRIYHSKLRW